MTTHSWAYQPSHPAYRTAWPTIVDDARRIIDHVRRLGIVVAGPDGRSGPILDPASGIEFNGDATTDLAGDPFTLMAPLPDHPRGLPTATAAVTTNRRPYDLAVTCALLVNDRKRLRREQPQVRSPTDRRGRGRASAPAAAPFHAGRRQYPTGSCDLRVSAGAGCAVVGRLRPVGGWDRGPAIPASRQRRRGHRRHVPDYLLLTDAAPVVVDVKPAHAWTDPRPPPQWPGPARWWRCVPKRP